MKTKITLLFILFTSSVFLSQGQGRVKEADILGNWKLIIELEEAMDEAKEELEEEDNIIGKIVLSSVSGFVQGLVDAVDIYFEFFPDGKLEVTVDAFGDTEKEYSKWSIDKKGRLFIEDTDSFSSNEEDYWTMKDGVLSNSDLDEGKYVYLVRLDK